MLNFIDDKRNENSDKHIIRVVSHQKLLKVNLH